jgi:hypothetical protein
MNPMDTLSCLDELQNLGFTDAAFSQLHHFREKQRNETILGFRHYCERIGSFHADQNNERVHKRLVLVLEHYKSYHSGDPFIFTKLADAAYYMIPVVPF